MTKNRTLVLSIALGGYDLVFRNCIKSQQDYCDRLGYEYRLITDSHYKLTASVSSWLKIVLIIKALKSGYDTIFFIDADCLVRPHTPGIEQIVADTESIYVAQGYSGRINAGVIIVKNTPQSLAFFQNILDKCEIKVPQDDYALYENGHMIHYGKNSPEIKIIPRLLWNNNSEIDEKSYVQHYSGGPLRAVYLNNNSLYLKARIVYSKILNKYFTKNSDVMKGVGLKEQLLQLSEHYQM
ncbi:DUF273 domain-containing protein [Hymenobacter sp. BT683]|uniref:DUF273 domain-containing protein n=1 Tax=Hymenobacter jeongseonensis TaxID=2791027 RepID=A0ABS0II56_9BACT|nr:DUF273 domain-containing protein [Hymenobacter jeongseonensis]MBF9237485.1 DUF273 domain-containing protein [Hymenobacter jeongseonensis]